jgi:AAA+ superfamily predicted ATPase
MTTKISVDPMTPNSFNDVLHTPTIPNPSTPPTTHYNMYNLQNMMQMQVLNKVMTNLSFIQTGDPMFDTIIGTIAQTLIIGLVTLMVTQLGTFVNFSKDKITSLFFFVMYGIPALFSYVVRKFKKQRKIIKRNVDIPYISDTRQINELYKAVYWFLTNDTEINYLHEPYLQYVFDKKITVDTREQVKKNLSLHKILSQQKTKDIEFKNHKIKYSLSTELITVYTDKDRKRENFKVSLSTDVDECEQTDVLEQFCQHCLVEYINNLTSNTWQQMIYINKNGEWSSSPSNNTRKLDTIILKKGLKEEIKNDLQLFLNSEDWYKERDIPYTRGYLFYGYPGTGKTSMIKGVSMYCKRHIHYLMLSEVKSDSELLDLFKKINYKDTVLVIEDIDAMAEIVKSREMKEEAKSKEKIDDSSDDSDNDDKKKKKKDMKKDKNSEYIDNDKNANTQQLTLSGLLNALDGVFACNGRMLIMTTNHPEVLDSALIRPGRVDSKYLFDNCNKDQIKGLYEMFFNQAADNDQINKIINDEYSPAHITSVFLRYRNNPKEALLHLDDMERKIVITPLVNQNTPKKELVSNPVEEHNKTKNKEAQKEIKEIIKNLS